MKRTLIALVVSLVSIQAMAFQAPSQLACQGTRMSNHNYVRVDLAKDPDGTAVLVFNEQVPVGPMTPAFKSLHRYELTIDRVEQLNDAAKTALISGMGRVVFAGSGSMNYTLAIRAEAPDANGILKLYTNSFYGGNTRETYLLNCTAQY